MTRRVAITGMGTVTPCGNNLPTFWDSMIHGKGGVGRLTRFDPEGFTSQVVGEVKDFDPTEFIDRKALRHSDRFVKYAWVASLEAYAQSGLTEANMDGERLAVIIGSGIGGIETLETQHKVLLERNPSRVSPFFVPMMISDMASGQLSIVFGAKGPNFCTVSACASGAHAIGEAYRLIREGYSDAVLAGGAESPITPLALAGFCSMKALSTRNDSPETASRPFDKDRDGFVMAEGAATLVLEDWEHAKARDADILGEMIGYASTADAHHVTAPEPNGEGAGRAMKLAMEFAGIRPEEVDYLNAHGTSTPLNDRGETLAIRSVFGAHADKLMVSSTKSMTGHLLGAAGAAEAAASILALREGLIPPTINHEVPGEDCDLDYVVGTEAREKKISVVLSNSLGFGGHNVSLLFRAV